MPPLLIGAVFFAARGAGRPAPAPELKVLSKSDKPVTAYDPADARDNSDFFFLENILSPLMEYSSGNSLVSGLAESYEWRNGQARLRLRSGLATVDGHPITAADAELSLKRLLILGGAKYSFLSVPLCGKPPRRLSDPCPGLRAEDSDRTLVMDFPEPRTFLFRLLANIDYSVIPRASFDHKTLKLTDYRNTSGPYYVHADSGGGRVTLKANPAHYRYSPDMPGTITVEPIEENTLKERVFRLLKDGAGDYLTVSVVRRPSDKLRFVEENPGYAVHFTRPLRLLCVVFTAKGRGRLSLPERFFIAARLRELYLERNLMGQAPDQIFHLEGQLSPAQAGRLRELFAAAGGNPLLKPVAADRLHNYFSRDGEAIKKWLPRVIYADRLRKQRKQAPEPDFRIFSAEIGLQDDLSLALHYLDSDFFGLTASETEAWRQKYLAAADKRERMALLRELQFDTMARGRALPIGLMPYASLARRPWVFNYPEAIAGDQLWRLRRQKWTQK